MFAARQSSTTYELEIAGSEFLFLEIEKDSRTGKTTKIYITTDPDKGKDDREIVMDPAQWYEFKKFIDGLVG